MIRNMRTCSLTFGLVVVAACAAARAAEVGDEAPASVEQIAGWIEQLEDRSYVVREAAEKSLLAAGSPAIEPVARAAGGKSAEASHRGLRILAEWASSETVATAAAASKSLAELAGSKHPAAGKARQALRARLDRLIAALERCGAVVSMNNDQVAAVNFDDAAVLGDNLRLLHELPDVTYLSFVTPLMDDAGMAAIQGLPRLEQLSLYRSRIGDEGLKHLKTFPKLRRVPMGETLVTDRGLVHLKDLQQIEYIGLRANDVTDAGLVALKNLKTLTHLHLGETQVTDAGLEHLKGLSALGTLELWQTRATEAGAARLREALPQLRINLTMP